MEYPNIRQKEFEECLGRPLPCGGLAMVDDDINTVRAVTNACYVNLYCYKRTKLVTFLQAHCSQMFCKHISLLLRIQHQVQYK